MQSDPPNFNSNFIENYEKYLPLEAYLYFPTSVPFSPYFIFFFFFYFYYHEIKIGEEKKGYRRIYEGQVQFDMWEIDMLTDFQKFLIKNKYKTIAWYKTKYINNCKL